uniref:Uncharacterized protein n=1 Tax=Aegilops tauschii TaxID=37682 RepID=N1QU56_AEGTA
MAFETYVVIEGLDNSAYIVWERKYGGISYDNFDKENFNLAPTYGNVALFIFSLAHQQQRWWRHCRPCSMWHNHVHCLLWGRSDLRLQVWLPHPLFTMCSVHLAGISRIIFDGCKDCNSLNPSLRKHALGVAMGFFQQPRVVKKRIRIPALLLLRLVREGLLRLLCRAVAVRLLVPSLLGEVCFRSLVGWLCMGMGSAPPEICLGMWYYCTGKGGSPVHVGPACAGSEEGSDHFGSIAGIGFGGGRRWQVMGLEHRKLTWHLKLTWSLKGLATVLTE